MNLDITFGAVFDISLIWENISTPRVSTTIKMSFYIELTFQVPGTEFCFRHPLFDLRRTRKVEIRHTNSKSRKVEVFDLTIVKKLSTFRPHVYLEK